MLLVGFNSTLQIVFNLICKRCIIIVIMLCVYLGSNLVQWC